jgi:ADP-ribosylglycohydrolase
MSENQDKAQPLPISRAIAALKTMFIADALAMPVHWYYNRRDIEKAFPGGVKKMEDAPSYHPSSIMSLHSTTQGGRHSKHSSGPKRQIVGDVILKGRGQYWGQQNIHYHHQMKAGENTINAQCARVLIRSMITSGGKYDKSHFLDAYIDFMTADIPGHSDTYAESYHRGFFANYVSGKAKDKCGALTHDTPSVGGLVSIAPIAIVESLRGGDLDHVQSICRKHLHLTHPDQDLAKICDDYVELIVALLTREENTHPKNLIAATSQKSVFINLENLVSKACNDFDVVGNQFSTACYISESWPSLLFLAYKYIDKPSEALIANTNLGGDNVHRGIVLGIILGLSSGSTIDYLFNQLVCKEDIASEIEELMAIISK